MKNESIVDEKTNKSIDKSDAAALVPDGPRWTPKQLEAIERRKENLLVAAAAGSGKTSVMVERVKRMVCDEGIPVEDILVVTFTNAAAAEMKDRIRKALIDAVDAEDPNTDGSRKLREQIRNLPLAQISTFHAFGMSVIKRFFYLTDMDPGTRVGEETEFAILKENALDALLEEEFEKAEPSFIEFMDNYSGDRSDYKVRMLILDAAGKIYAMPHGMDWAYDRVKEMEDIRNSFGETGLWRILKEDIGAKLEKAIALTKRAADILCDAGIDEKAEQLRAEEIAKYEEVLAIFGSTRSAEEIMKEASTILNAKIPNLTAPKGELAEVYKSIQSSFQGPRDEARKIIRTELVKPYFASDISDLFTEVELDAVPLKELLRLVERFTELYAEEKRDAGLMDFDDIERYTFAILENDEACEYYRSRLKYIFVDEYQDTNLMQEAIISRIKGSDNLFMVGDIKQSIYKFRLAEPSIFQGKYERFKSGEEESSAVVDLNRNHRSKKTIVDFINGIFRPLMAGYDKDAELYCGIDYDGELLREPEIHIVMASEDAAPKEEPDSNSEAWDKVYLEAKHVARIIKENLGKPFMDSKAKAPHERPLEKRDIVVLMRSVSNYAGLYSQALEEEGIDAYLEGDDGYFDTLEIGAFINLLTVIDNINQDVPLLSVLHSGIFGFTSKELAEIRVLCRNGSFADAFTNLAKSEDYEEETDAEKAGAITTDEKQKLITKCKAVLEKISYWQDLSLAMPLDKYIWRLMLESNCYVSMGALPRGGARQANLRALCDMAEKYAAERQATLYGFLNYVSAVKAGNVKIPEVSALGEGDDVVRIMTIHKSKGLEFPMVIISGLGSSKTYGRGGTFRLHKDIGLALTLKSGKEHWKKDVLLQSMIKSRAQQEEIEEEIRVLYVALTRARDILYLVGYEDKDIDEFAENGIISTSQYMKMIIPGHDYKVFHVSAESEVSDKEIVSPVERFDIPELTEEKKEAILAQLNYRYPFEEARKLKSKYSVSELNKSDAKEADGEGVRPQRTFFVASNSEDVGGILADITAAERGTAYHKVFERLDFAKASDEGYIDAELNIMEEKGILSEEEKAAVEVDRIKAFFETDIGRRAAAAATRGMLEKERPFTLVIDKDGHDVLVQGVIDCYFREEIDGELRTVLLDYKSNKVRKDLPIEEEIKRLSDMYRKQLEIYRIALTEAGLVPVDDAYLYLLDIGRAISV